MRSLNSTAVNLIGGKKDPLQELWCAVLYTAIDDAFNQVRVIEARSALAWLKGFSEDFCLVCPSATEMAS